MLHAEGRTHRMDIKPAESAAEGATLFVYKTTTAHRGSDSVRRISHTFTSLPQNDGNRNCGNRACSRDNSSEHMRLKREH